MAQALERAGEWRRCLLLLNCSMGLEARNTLLGPVLLRRVLRDELSCGAMFAVCQSTCVVLGE